ncbi:hypothetical protein ACRRTK_007334 [Alexandromys fortis]
MGAGRGLRAPASGRRGRGLAKAGRAQRRLGNARASAGPGRASLLLVASEAEGLARRVCGGVSGCWYRGCRGHPLLVMRESEEIRPPRLRSLAETSHSNCTAPEQARPQLAPLREKRERPGGVDSATGTLVRDPLWIT